MKVNDQSFGVVPLQKKGPGWQVLLIQHSKSLYWGFPKGHAEGKESYREAAVRELHEETNLEIALFLSDDTFKIHYEFPWQGKTISKTVYYFVAEVKGTLRLQLEEISGGQWVSLDKASDTLTYETDKSICRQVVALINS